MRESLRCDAIVVGSGAGGAPVAAALAEAGLDVVVLEAGARFETRDFSGEEGEMIARLMTAKGSALVSRVPDAEARGARVVPLARADRIEVAGGGVRAVQATRLDPRTRQPVGFRRRARTRDGGAAVPGARGRGAAQGFCDESGRAFDVAGLYVTDAAALPSNTGANPQITIMANALRIAGGITAARGGRRSDEESVR